MALEKYMHRTVTRSMKCPACKNAVRLFTRVARTDGGKIYECNTCKTKYLCSCCSKETLGKEELKKFDGDL